MLGIMYMHTSLIIFLLSVLVTFDMARFVVFITEAIFMYSSLPLNITLFTSLYCNIGCVYWVPIFVHTICTSTLAIGNHPTAVFKKPIQNPT